MSKIKYLVIKLSFKCAVTVCEPAQRWDHKIDWSLIFLLIKMPLSFTISCSRSQNIFTCYYYNWYWNVLTIKKSIECFNRLHCGGGVAFSRSPSYRIRIVWKKVETEFFMALRLRIEIYLVCFSNVTRLPTQNRLAGIRKLFF